MGLDIRVDLENSPERFVEAKIFLPGSIHQTRNLQLVSQSMKVITFPLDIWSGTPPKRKQKTAGLFSPTRSSSNGQDCIYQADLHFPASRSCVLLLPPWLSHQPNLSHPHQNRIPTATSSGALEVRASSCSWGRGGEREGCTGGGNPAAAEFTTLLWCL